MNHLTKAKTRLIAQWAILVVLVAVLLATLYVVVRNFEIMRLRGNIRVSRNWHQTSRKILPDQIEGWMTFRYVNFEFNLPQDYLKNALFLNNARYPNLSLDSLAKQQNLTSAKFLANVIQAVKNYSPSKPDALRSQ